MTIALNLQPIRFQLDSESKFHVRNLETEEEFWYTEEDWARQRQEDFDVISEPIPEEERTTYLIQGLDARSFSEYLDEFPWGGENEKVKQSHHASNYLLERGLRGWEQLWAVEPRGEEIPFDAANIRRMISLLPLVVRNNLAAEIHLLSIMNDRDRRNLLSQQSG